VVRRKEGSDKIVIEPLEGSLDRDGLGETAFARTKTSPRPRPGHRIDIDIDDADSLSDFLLTISRLVRERRKITIIIE